MRVWKTHPADTASRRLLSMASHLTAIQIDPALPVVWEDETTLRVGFDRPVARVSAPSPAAQRVVAWLIRGASADELARECARVTERVLAALKPALVTRAARSPSTTGMTPALSPHAPPHTPPHTPPPTALNQSPRAPVPAQSRPAAAPPNPEVAAPPKPAVAAPPNPTAAAAPNPAGPAARARSRRAVRTRISDDGRELPWLRAALEATRMCVFPRGAAPELAIEVLRFLEPLGRTRRWLGVGVPHLLIRFTDEAARVGPLVGPSGGPCHGCETLLLTDRDPALPAIAAQLYGGVPSSETPEVAVLVAAIAAQYVQAWRRREPWPHTQQATVPVLRGTVSGLPTVAEIATHPECGCAISSEPRPPPRTERAGERSEPRSRSPTAAARLAHA